MTVRNATKEEVQVVHDLVNKMTVDMLKSINTSMSLVGEAAGASGIAYAAGQLAAGLIVGATCCLNDARGKDSGSKPSDDDYLYCGLVVTADNIADEPSLVTDLASEWFTKITGCPPDLPDAWNSEKSRQAAAEGR